MSKYNSDRVEAEAIEALDSFFKQERDRVLALLHARKTSAVTREDVELSSSNLVDQVKVP